MPWVIDPQTGYQVWEEPAAPASATPQLGTASHAAPGAAQAVTPVSQQQKNNDALIRSVSDPNSPNYRGPGYAHSVGADGAVQAKLVDPAANQMWKYQRDQAAANPNVGAPMADPAAAAAAQPAAPATPQQSLAAASARGVGAFQGAAPLAPQRAATGPQAGGDALARTKLPAAAGAPAAAAPTAGGVQVDYSRYDQAAQDLQNARNTFQSELDRLAGVDPFGNQAFLQKATDRAVAQAAGTAAGARGGAAALAGANRQAVGVQSQMAARGIQEMEQQKVQDARMASGLRLQAAGGIADVSQAAAQNEVALANQGLQAAEANLNAYMQKYGIDAQIGQAERESLRQLAVAMRGIDMEKYKTDANYRMNVDNNVITKYTSDNQLKAILAQIDAQENMSTGEVLMGLLGAGGGLGQAAIMTMGGPAGQAAGGGQAAAKATSDRRAKIDIHDPDRRDLQDFLGNTKGKLYRYKEPDKPGRKHGLNFGPMAQDLAKSRIGATLVDRDAEGTLRVDTSRLALADHAALAAVAGEVAELRRLVSRKRGRK